MSKIPLISIAQTNFTHICIQRLFDFLMHKLNTYMENNVSHKVVLQAFKILRHSA